MISAKIKENSIPLSIRLSPEQYKQVIKVVRDNPLIYGSINHFFRVAMIREINRENKYNFEV